MLALEVMAVVVLLLLAVAATWMAIVGLMGAIGALRMKRCRACGHLVAGGSPGPSITCPFCRHPWLLRHVVPVRLHHLLPDEMETTVAALPNQGSPGAMAH